MAPSARGVVIALLTAMASACSRGEPRNSEPRATEGRDAATTSLVSTPPVWSPPPPPPPPPPPADSDAGAPPPTGAAPADATITLQRTACFGSCPAYSVVLRGDGRVDFRGDTHVRVDHAERRIASDAAQKVFASLAENGFWGWKDHYRIPITDQPTAMVTVSWGGRTKSVSEYPPCDKESGAPPELCILGNTVDRVTRSDEWTKCKDAAGHPTPCAMRGGGTTRGGKGCDVPFTIDAQGKKHFKPECVGL